MLIAKLCGNIGTDTNNSEKDTTISGVDIFGKPNTKIEKLAQRKGPNLDCISHAKPCNVEKTVEKHEWTSCLESIIEPSSKQHPLFIISRVR